MLLGANNVAKEIDGAIKNPDVGVSQTSTFQSDARRLLPNRSVLVERRSPSGKLSSSFCQLLLKKAAGTKKSWLFWWKVTSQKVVEPP